MQNVKQNIMKYKILFILSFILLSLLLFNTNVFASYNVTHNGVTYNVPDLPREVVENENLTIIKTSVNSKPYILIYTTSADRIALNYATGGVNTIRFLISCSYYDEERDNYYSCSDGYEKYYYSTSNSSWISFDSAFDDSNPTVIKSNLDVFKYNYDYSEKTLVFQAPVPEKTLAQVLAETQENNPKLTLVEIAKILTLIIVVVVSLVGFRKAWKILRTSLNRS